MLTVVGSPQSSYSIRAQNPQLDSFLREAFPTGEVTLEVSDNTRVLVIQTKSDLNDESTKTNTLSRATDLCMGPDAVFTQIRIQTPNATLMACNNLDAEFAECARTIRPYRLVRPPYMFSPEPERFENAFQAALHGLTAHIPYRFNTGIVACGAGFEIDLTLEHLNARGGACIVAGDIAKASIGQLKKHLRHADTQALQKISNSRVKAYVLDCTMSKNIQLMQEQAGPLRLVYIRHLEVSSLQHLLTLKLLSAIAPQLEAGARILITLYLDSELEVIQQIIEGGSLLEQLGLKMIIKQRNGDPRIQFIEQQSQKMNAVDFDNWIIVLEKIR